MQLDQRTPMGTVIKTLAVYDAPFWRDSGLNGMTTSDTGPVKLTYDNSPPDGSPGVLLGFLEGRDHAAKLCHQSDARPFVKRASVLTGVLFQTGDGAGNQRVVIGHRILCQVSNGLRIRIVSSRSGLVDSKATGQPINSSIRRTYLIAAPGSCVQLRAPAVFSDHPSNSS